VVRHVGRQVTGWPLVVLLLGPRGQGEPGLVDRLVGHLGHQVGDAVEPGAPLVVGLHHVPRGLGGVGVQEHGVLGPRVVDPPLPGLQVDGAELPSPERVVHPALEPPLLLLVADREPVLDEDDPVLDELVLEDRALAEEPLVLVVGAEPHDPFHPGPVVPAPVEEGHLAGRGQLAHVALEVPLAPLPVGRRGQGHDATGPRAQVLRHPLDGAPLAGRVAPLEQDHHPGAALADPLGHGGQFALEPEELLLVEPLRNYLGHRSSPLPPPVVVLDDGPAGLMPA
jgi:hypothetical protein